MIHLCTTVKLRGALIDARVTPVRGPFLVGAHPDARVPFPGATLPVSPVPPAPHPFVPAGRLPALSEPAVAIGGVVLGAGASWTLRAGDLEVEFTAERAAAPDPWRRLGASPVADLRLLAAMGAIVVFGLWFDTVERWATRDPEVVAELHSLSETWSRVWAPAEPTVAPEATPPEAPGVRVVPVGVAVHGPSAD